MYRVSREFNNCGSCVMAGSLIPFFSDDYFNFCTILSEDTVMHLVCLVARILGGKMDMRKGTKSLCFVGMCI